MSYPSINAHLDEMGTTPDDASDEQLHAAFISAFKQDLALGFARVRELVAKLRDGSLTRAMLTLDPKSVEGQQFARLLGPDIPRRVLEQHFEVSFGFYNCCKGVVSDTREGLELSLREQVEAQHPSFADC